MVELENLIVKNIPNIYAAGNEEERLITTDSLMRKNLILAR